MKSTLEFSLPEERDEHRHACNGALYYGVLLALDEKIRRMRKDDSHITAHELMDAVREDIADAIATGGE